MPRSIENISENIIKVTYPLSSIPADGQSDLEPIDFTWNGKRVVSQSEVIFTPITVYRYETDDSGLMKKQTANGEVAYTDSKVKIPAYDAFSVRLSFSIGPDELLLGMGQYEDGIYDYRNHTEYLYESNMRIAIPFLVTTGNYGILIDSGSSMVFASEGNRITFTIDCASELSYYIFTGADIGGIVKCYHHITGMPSMLPRWTFGYIQSKERYQSSAELEDIVSSFRSKNIPIDCIVQDWFSWEDGLWGEKKFDKKRYPNLPSTIKKLHDDHVHFMVSIWPNMSTDSDNYAEFADKDLLLPNSNLYDVFKEDARDLYWKQTQAEIMSSGTDALWCDNAEPFSDADWSGEVKKPESERYRVVKELSEQSMDPEMLNSYGLCHAKGIYENWRKSLPDKRVVNLTRSGYTGIQKYGAILWSGDICATYDTLRKQITEGIKMGLTGMPYWTLDIGGFFVVNDKYENRGCNDRSHTPVWFWHGDYNDGVKDMGYRELYVRWLEFGTFLPIFRSHGTDTPREPWQFGSEGDMFYDAILSHIRLRYRLIPYLYSLGAAAHRLGDTIMRSLL
ncbi:MAG: glycoside hydrolase, partial [Lachnospiraceae bacterium]|nr:glycoside hydrolase [Lachnospiraceae bacterium]